jgi:hypothetical protein
MNNMNIIELVKSLSENYTKIISTDVLQEYSKKHKCLYWGKNGIGSRWCKSKYNYSCIFYKKVNNYSDNIENNVSPEVLLEFRNLYNNRSTSGIIGIFVYSLKETNNINRPISKIILKQIKNQNCVVCGSNSDIVCDHKNDLYNDIRVLSVNTQDIEDFQPLCNHCNLQKREISKKEKIQNKIYSAKCISSYKSFPFIFPWEYKDFRIDDITTKIDTYWYSPVEFNRKISVYFILLPVLQEIKKSIKYYINP